MPKVVGDRVVRFIIRPIIRRFSDPQSVVLSLLCVCVSGAVLLFCSRLGWWLNLNCAKHTSFPESSRKKPGKGGVCSNVTKLPEKTHKPNRRESRGRVLRSVYECINYGRSKQRTSCFIIGAKRSTRDQTQRPSPCFGGGEGEWHLSALN